MKSDGADGADGPGGASSGPARPGRKRKFTPDKARELMVAESVEQLLRAGISARLEAVRLDRVLVLSEVPRGSAYQAWEHPDRTPQENLQHAVALHILEKTTANNAQPTINFGLGVIGELEDDINSGDLERKRYARSEITRRTAQFNHDLLNSDMWNLYRTLVLTTNTQPDPDPDILAAIERGEARLIAAYSDLFIQFAEVLDMTLKPGTTLKQFVMAIIALNDGLANHKTKAFDQSEPLVGPDGRVWTLYGYGCEALFTAFWDIAA